MSLPRPSEPPLSPAAPQHAAPRRLPPTGILVVSLLAVVVAVTALGLLLFGRPGGPSDEDAVAKPLLVVPSTTAETTVPVQIFTTNPDAQGTNTTAPARTQAPTKRATPTVKPPKIPKTPEPTKTRSKPVRAGAPCSPLGAVGRNNKGLPMICAPSADGRTRWRRI